MGKREINYLGDSTNTETDLIVRDAVTGIIVQMREGKIDKPDLVLCSIVHSVIITIVTNQILAQQGPFSPEELRNVAADKCAGLMADFTLEFAKTAPGSIDSCVKGLHKIWEQQQHDQ